MSQITEQHILDSLRHIIDPDLHKDIVSLGFVNRLLGMLFGALRSILIMSVCFCVLNAIDARRSFLPAERIEESKFYNPISDIAPAIFPIIGEGGFNLSFDRFKKQPEGVTI